MMLRVRTARLLWPSVVGLLLLTGCGEEAGTGNPRADNTSATVSDSISPTDTPSSVSTSSEPTDTQTSSSRTLPTTVGTPTSSEPPVLDEEAAGVALTLTDFFQPDSAWAENRYDIADRQDVQGIAAVIGSCSNALPLELRLANNFNNLSFDVGQANTSDGSNQVLTVEVIANNQQVDIRRVPFNLVQPFLISVPGVNALQILFYLDSETDNCGSESVIAVLHNVILT